MPRAAYALSRAFVTTGDNGKTQPNFSRILGNLTSASMANLYERDSVRHRDRFGTVSEFNRRVGVGPTLRTFGVSTAVGALSHVLFDEFDVVLDEHRLAGGETDDESLMRGAGIVIRQYP